ncbi:MAG TPA: helix-turn-helix domain-containing protein [Longimicrobium sp.]|jgi:DNA-binding Xre family transcriptional regulator
MSQDLLLVADRHTDKWTDAGFPARPLRSGDDVRGAYLRADRRRPVLWVARRACQLRPLAEEGRSLRPNHRLLLLSEVEGPARDLLHLLFRVVVAPGDGVRLLPPDELQEVLAAPNRGDYFIGGQVEPCTETVILYRGNLEPVVVPFSWFDRRAPVPPPDFHDFEVTDYGLTVRLGTYEAATDAVLYMFDADYRRRAKERQLEQDDSFGACLRRLRLMKEVSRDDFPGVSEKQIARIERGEIERPHRKTLRLIAERLGVEPGDISTY